MFIQKLWLPPLCTQTVPSNTYLAATLLCKSYARHYLQCIVCFALLHTQLQFRTLISAIHTILNHPSKLSSHRSVTAACLVLFIHYSTKKKHVYQTSCSLLLIHRNFHSLCMFVNYITLALLHLSLSQLPAL